MNILKQYLRTRFDLPESEINNFLSIGKEFQAEENHYILKPEHISNRIFFVEEGIIREFEKTSDSEKTTWILGENNWLYNMPSYYKNDTAKCYLQALINTKGYYFLKSDIEQLVQESHLWAITQTKVYQQYLLQMIYRNELHRLKNAAEKLVFFEKHQPNVQNRIKLKHVASYLNITQVQLSRVRKARK
ncbi:MAG: hypothetical protein QMB24_14555 [Spirosomataceae bacterium]